MLLSDYLLLSVIKLAVDTLEAYNSHDDGALNDDKIQASDIAVKKEILAGETKTNLLKEGRESLEQENIDAERFFEDGVEYEIIQPKKPQNTVDASKIEKWKAQINFSLFVKLAGINLSIFEQDELTKEKNQLIFI